LRNVEKETRGAEFLAVMTLLEGIGRKLLEISRLIKKIREKSGKHGITLLKF